MKQTVVVRPLVLALLFAGFAAIPPAGAIANSGAAATVTCRTFALASSILLAALPYLFAGAASACALMRLAPRNRLAPLLALAAPGCDCSINGFAGALRDHNPALAGFALTFSAACGPAALLATHAVLGNSFVAARIAGGSVAAVITAISWSVARSGGPSACAHDRAASTLCDHLDASIRGFLVPAIVAALLVTLAPDAARALPGAPFAALAGAVLSPCSTADAVLARVLFVDHHSQAAFVIAAQCVDLRQLAMLRRNFGTVRCALAALAGCAGCAVAAAVVR